MKIAHISDVHLTDRGGESDLSLSDQLGLLHWIADDAERESVDLVAIAGDFFDHLSTPLGRLAAVEAVQRFGEFSEVVIVEGNHDRPFDLDVLSKVRSVFPVSVHSSAKVSPMLFEGRGAVVGVLPWPRKAKLAASIGAQSAVADLEAAGRAAMGDIFRGFGVEFSKARVEGLIPLLFGHVEIGAARTDLGQPVAGRADLPLNVGELVETGAAYIGLGHIHKPQAVPGGAGRVWYSGSIRPTKFGEDGSKGYALVEVGLDSEPRVEIRRAPYMDLETVDGVFAGGVLEWLAEPDSFEPLGFPLEELYPSGSPCFLRLKYSVHETERAAGAEAVNQIADRLLALGHRVKTVPTVEAASKVRAAAVAAATTTTEKIVEFWKSRGEEPKRKNEILSLADEIEEEVATAAA